MAKTKRPRGKRSTSTTILCEWCQEQRECTRGDVKTCGERCRARLSVYCRTLGYAPDDPPGPITAQQAIDLEIHRLVMQEKRRRDAVAAERKAYLATPHGRIMSGAGAPLPPPSAASKPRK